MLSSVLLKSNRIFKRERGQDVCKRVFKSVSIMKLVYERTAFQIN